MFRRNFLTGCDSNTEWQLPWFLQNFFDWSEVPLMVADFGMSEEMRSYLKDHPFYSIKFNVVSSNSSATGWFKKPRAIYDATIDGHKVCWLDTDCQIDGDIDTIWNYFEHGKLGMVVDRPWTKRRPNNGDWYNSGVVMTDRNNVLESWMLVTESTPKEGDQEVLHGMYTPIERLSKIYPLPHKYNTLRIDYIDNVAVKDPIVIHHTGRKGNDTIRELMNK
jgi:hypothetical protein